MNGPKETGREQSRPASDNQPSKQIGHATDLSIVASFRRPLPQELHADLGIVDDGHAVGT
jgi:hypothetical protein